MPPPALHTYPMTQHIKRNTGEPTTTPKQFAWSFCLWMFLLALLCGRAMEYLPKDFRQELAIVMHALELAAAVVGLVAIWYAVEHKLHIDGVRDNIEDALHTLREVANAATTRYRGPFPQHI